MNWLTLLARFVGLFFIAAGIPIYKLIYDQTQSVPRAVIGTLIYEAVVLAVGFLTKVWQRLEVRWADRAADRVDVTLLSLFSRFRRKYLEYLVYQNRAFDVKGLSTQGPYNLDLEKVYVQLDVDPTPLHGVATNPLQELPEHLKAGEHTIWQYLTERGAQEHNFAILGAPGSGKTTLLKHMALTLAGPAHHRRKLGAPGLLPILLFLRDHAQKIRDEPAISLAKLIQDQFESRQAPLPPAGWIENQLRKGKCLVLLDGLDEVADAQTRREVVNWVEQRMITHGKNRFILSSRPYGYRSNPLAGVTVLRVRPFTSHQQEQFVNNWYLANEIMSSRRDDPGVREDARRGASDLLERIRSTRTLSDLAVNPLLLTMIATVHRYRSRLPGRRVELYVEICEVFLGKRQEARGLALDLTPAQKMRVLRPLAYGMMETSLRSIPAEAALSIISVPLAAVHPNIRGEDFLTDVENGSGLLVEPENGAYSFSHMTFQEFLASTHIIESRVEEVLLQQVNNPWWRETTRLYCAQTDASNVISACLKSLTTTAFSLAIECMDEAREVDPKVREEYERVIERGAEDPDAEMRKLVAAALLERRTR
jgi:energy-coupling factor transporter ATP-binding protein EcfA2